MKKKTDKRRSAKFNPELTQQILNMQESIPFGAVLSFSAVASILVRYGITAIEKKRRGA